MTEKWAIIKLVADVTIIIISASYLTLGIFAQDRARSLWWVYSVVIIALTALNIGIISLAKRGNDGRSDS